MKISYNWLKKHINIDIPAEELSELLTDCGLEVEALEEVCSVKGGLKGVVIGKVVHKEKHPDADRLSLTKVDIASGELLDIVCGAPNVAEGQKVLVATVGTRIYLKDGDFIIKKNKIRGFNSEGMICAEDELGLGDSHAGIMVLPEDAQVGTTASDYFKIETDWLFEIGLTPNRADAASHLGVARDVFAIIKNRDLLQQNKKELLVLKTEEKIKIELGQKGLSIDIVIENQESCPRYSGITITGVTVKESPEWLQNKLKIIGLKPINNIVDISNYVLFDLGQPLHIFDADKIIGEKVIVRKFKNDFEFVTLDGVTQQMSPDDLMICNTMQPMCIAGVYGGLNSGITSSTKNIFIESACFNPVTIRRTSKRLGIKTDASFRFERGTDPNITVRALKDAVLLIKELAGGVVTSDVKDCYPQPISNSLIVFNYENFFDVAGKIIDKRIIKSIIQSLEIIIYKEEDDKIYLSVPPYRVDVTREIDVVEEVLRIYGYNNIEMSGQIKASLSYSQKPDKENVLNIISDFLSSNGYNEIMSNSLTKSEYYENLSFFDKEKNVKLLNPLSKDLETLRQTLVYSGLETISYNHNRKIFDLKLFEYGKIYELNKSKKDLEKYSESYRMSLFQTGFNSNETWAKSQALFDFFSLKTDVFNVLKRTGINPDRLKVNENADSIFIQGLSYQLNKKPILSIGSLQPEILKYFDIRQAVFYAEFDIDLYIEMLANVKFQIKEVSRFPKMRRDLALLIDDKVQFSEIEKIAHSINNSLLKEVGLFDVYAGSNIEKGKKSYAVSFIFQDAQKTLTDAEVDSVMNQLINLYKKNLGAVIR